LHQLQNLGAFISKLWSDKRTRLSTYLLITLVIGVWVGQASVDTEAIDAGRTEKGVEVAKTGVITITLPGLELDPDVFKFQIGKLTDVPVEIPVPGKLVFNAEKSKVLSARAAGRVERIHAFDGATVSSSQVIADFFSPDYVSAQQEYLLSLQLSKTLQDSSLKSLAEDAKSTLEASANRLRILGAADEDISRLRKGGAATSTFPLRSPIAGVVIKRAVEPGAFLNVGDVVATIADPKALWFMGNIYEQDIQKISKGQKLQLRSESYPDRVFTAVANYVSPTIDPVTHALMIRCDVDNADGALKPEMFVRAKLEVERTSAILVPRTAIIQVRNLRYAIVQGAKDTYRRVPIKGFDLSEQSFAVTEGLNNGDQILVMGSTLMNQRFLKQED
jgi:Cu(I)/Ag(I) efflux system membrane fusion protein